MEILSYIGTFFTALASLPQLYYTYQKSNSVALGSSMIRIIAAFVWGAWAIAKQEWVFTASCFIVCLAEIIIFTITWSTLQTTAQ